MMRTGNATRSPVRTTGRCFVPPFLEEGKAWGITLQLYELRSARNWGVGDFRDLAELCRAAAAAGADFVGINPLHALFLADAARCSPFSPSNRQFLNPLYIALDAIDPDADRLADETALEIVRNAGLVDYPTVAGLKLQALRTLWESRRPQADRQWDRFLEEGGEDLKRHALFEALSERMVAVGHGAGWRSWPSPFQDPTSGAVLRFADQHREAVDFQIWLQYLAAGQLAEVASICRECGMRIGLYLDLAVGEAMDGSATWSNPDRFVTDMSVGAPPDIFAAEGQDWGVAALDPDSLARTGAAHFRQLVAGHMRNAGALRIDHAMALRQLFLIPQGEPPSAGAYSAYPMDALVRTLADASIAHSAVVVGEDLGNVPEGFRDEMREAGILSYRIFYFEQANGRFLPAASYPRLALACLSTHDLPTLRGWWAGDDIALRLEHGLIDAEAAAAQRENRETERRSLLQLLGLPGDAGLHALASEIHAFLADTPSMLVAVRLADLAGERRPTNLPGTDEAYPNWRLRLEPTLDELTRSPGWSDVLTRVAEQRPRQR